MEHLALEHLIQPVVENEGYSFVGIECLNQSGNLTIRIYIDKDAGISTEDCSKVSLRVGSLLDVESELVYGKYNLEVSSPGLNRRLFTFEQCLRSVGAEVRIHLKSSQQGVKKLQGVLRSAKEGNLYLVLDGTEVEIAFDSIRKINVVPKW